MCTIKEALSGDTGKHPAAKSAPAPEAILETRGVLEWVPWEAFLPGAGEEARIERWRRQNRPNPR